LINYSIYSLDNNNNNNNNNDNNNSNSNNTNDDDDDNDDDDNDDDNLFNIGDVSLESVIYYSIQTYKKHMFFFPYNSVMCRSYRLPGPNISLHH
jgi:hypothetical protein